MGWTWVVLCDGDGGLLWNWFTCWNEAALVWAPYWISNSHCHVCLKKMSYGICNWTMFGKCRIYWIHRDTLAISNCTLKFVRHHGGEWWFHWWNKCYSLIWPFAHFSLIFITLVPDFSESQTLFTPFRNPWGMSCYLSLPKSQAWHCNNPTHQ